VEEALLREISEEYLVPFFSGARILERADDSSARDDVVSIRDPLSIGFKVNKTDRYRLVLTRSQPFSSSARPVIREIAVVRCFVSVLAKMETLLRGDLKLDLLSTFQRRVVARAIRGFRYENIMLGAIDQLANWAGRLYEGAPISSAIGFTNEPQTHELTLSKLGRQDFLAVLSNGFDTMLTFDFQSRLIDQENLDTQATLPPYCPMRQAAIAEWTTGEDKIALSLNRLGEILVFRSGQLIFARRSSRWHFLTHDPVIMQMGVPRDRDLRVAIYETCLDASFARTGACIGVVSHENRSEWTQRVSVADRLENRASLKSQALAKLIRGRRFTEIDRKTRQELAAIDGATIVAHDGAILAVGAILRISAGSTGGGRLAAAKVLGEQGLGVKVSQDGSISGFRGRGTDTVFRIM
jgi:hypothetical protein